MLQHTKNCCIFAVKKLTDENFKTFNNIFGVFGCML